jgi:aldose 1-epimerase
MKVPALKFLLPFLPLALGNNGGGGGYTGLPGAGLDGSSDGTKEYTLYADGINATFIGYGARLTHLYVNDKQGNPRDIVVGYDNPAEYVAETKPSYFGPVVG